MHAADIAELLGNWDSADRARVKEVVRASVRALEEVAPGRSVELRVPPFIAVQVIEGPAHRRGTPKAVIEMDARTWLELVVGHLSWAEGLRSGRVRASGERADLTPYLPLAVAGHGSYFPTDA
ncbi:MAG: hypothetical protein RJB01_1032 [Actinomycetota bacterium]